MNCVPKGDMGKPLVPPNGALFGSRVIAGQWVGEDGVPWGRAGPKLARPGFADGSHVKTQRNGEDAT